MEYVELGLMVFGLGCTVYFSWPHLGPVLRTAVGRWALGIAVVGVGVALAAGYTIDLVHAGIRPEREPAAQGILMGGLLVAALGMLALFALVIHSSYQADAPDDFPSRLPRRTTLTPPRSVTAALPEGEPSSQPVAPATPIRVGEKHFGG